MFAPCKYHMNCCVAALTLASQHSKYGGSRKGSDDDPGQSRDPDQEGGQKKETAMTLFSLTRFLRSRRVYWNTVQELSSYSDRELRDIGIDRADIHEIARLAAQEQQ